MDDDDASKPGLLDLLWTSHILQLIMLAVAVAFVVWIVHRLLTRRVGRLVCARKGHKRRGWKRHATGYAGYCGRCGQRLWKARPGDDWEEAD